MKIGLDFDGVIANCGQLKSDGAKKLYGVEIPPEKFHKEIVVGENYLTLDQYQKLQKIIYGTRAREIGLLMEPVAGVLSFLPRLIVDGHSVMVVTSRGEAELDIASEWSFSQGLRLDFIGVGRKENKARFVGGLDFYVDDDLDKLKPLVGIVPHLFLFSWGYNAHIDTGSIAKRLGSWEKMYNIISVLNKRNA